MASRATWRTLALFALLAAASNAQAQSLCRPTETTYACWDRLVEEVSPTAVKAEAAKTQAETPKKTETGLADLNGLSSSVKDFVPLLQMAGAIGEMQTDDKTGAVSVALNTRFLGGSGKLTEDPSFQLKAVVETKPKMFDKLKTQLPEDGRDDLVKRLLDAQKDADNVTLHASYSFTSRGLGRNFNQHAATFNALFAQAVDGPTTAATIQRLDAERALIKALGTASLENTLWGSLPPATQVAAQEALFAAVQKDIALTAAFTAAIKDPELNLFGQLVNNQPQLYVTAYKSFRHELYGPEVFSGRITYEMGLGNNLNAVFDDFDLRQCASRAGECLAHYTERVSDPAVKANIKAGSRLSVYAEFVQNDDYHYEDAKAGLDLSIAKGTAWAAAAEYGRLLGVDDAGAASGRVDASMRWEDPADAAAESRFVASLTITKKLGELSVPFGIVYANKPKFLTGVDHGLSATVGLRFKIFPELK